MAGKTYKLRKITKPNEKTGAVYVNASIAVPQEIAEQIPDDMMFAPEFTDEGILFRPIHGVSPVPSEIPSWLSGTTEEEEQPKQTAKKKPAAKAAA